MHPTMFARLVVTSFAALCFFATYCLWSPAGRAAACAFGVLGVLLVIGAWFVDWEDTVRKILYGD